ncbi:MAG: DUF4406 domain-containing protein [Lachnospiraceae bacterium]|nr:DUF4406 domain-containing protein [Lachnospiraceae bacterium]
MPMDYKNAEGYSDPTPYLALKSRFRPLVYICSAYSGDVGGNTEKARRYSRFAVDEGAIPIAPHLLFPQFLDEQRERELAMQMDLVLLKHCLEIWVFGRVTDGMSREIGLAERRNMKIRYFNEDLEELE